MGIMGGATDSIIELGLKGARKLYESEVQVINSISKADPEWFFCDKTVVLLSHKKLCNDLEKIKNNSKSFQDQELVKQQVVYIIKNLSLVTKNIRECRRYAREYGIDEQFVKFELDLIESDVNGDQMKAKDIFDEYSKSIKNISDVFHPITCWYFACEFIKGKKFEEAVSLLHRAICWAPDEIRFHQSLLEAYTGTENTEGIAVEKGIIELLN